MKDSVKQFNEAMSQLESGKLEEALVKFLKLKEIKHIAPFCNYRIAQISNMIGEPETAYSLYYEAFADMPDICAKLFTDEHPSHSYVYRGKKKEKETSKCPLCALEGQPHWCYPLVEAIGYNEFFNPVRMWMHCKPCHHLYARSFPEKLFLYNSQPRNANPSFFSYYSGVLTRIRANGYASGMRLFEVGIGACECMLAAREMGYETFGIDVIDRHVSDAKAKYGLDVETADFNEFEAETKWDLIIMGDVLEHVSDPSAALAKAGSMLEDGGALWISTPNFESAFTLVVGHGDSMRRQQFHCNYFSRESLFMLLERQGLAPVDYQISGHFKGSMEVIAIKESRLHNS